MIDRLQIGGIGPAAPLIPSSVPSGETAKGKGASFEAVFAEEVAKEGLKFSAHAEKRLASRGIAFSPEEMQNLSAAVDRAAAKGARESLILLGDTAFVVSVRNRTVITAIDGPNLKDNVFTNIDSAVIA